MEALLIYIKAEFYKACRRRYTWVFLAVMLALETLFALMWIGPREFDYMVALLATTMQLGCFLSVILVSIVVSDSYKTGTLKNEVSFGLSRSRIYLGKLWAAALLSLAFCGVILLYYLGGCRLLTGPGDGEAVRANLAVLGYVTAASLPLWLGCLGLAMALFFLLHNEVAGVTGMFLFLTMGELVLSLLAGLQIRPVQGAVRWLAGILPNAPFGEFQGELTWGLMARCWLLGLGWLAGSTAVGLAVFRRRDL